MLSSAHVLAMDAKHLLDVIDKIHMNYHHINKLIFEVTDILLWLRLRMSTFTWW